MRSALHRLKPYNHPSPRKLVSFFNRVHNSSNPNNWTGGTAFNLRSSARIIVTEAPLPQPESENGGGLNPEEREESIASVHRLLNSLMSSSVEANQITPEECGLNLSDDLVLDVIKRHDSNWKSAFAFFNWVSRRSEHSIGSPVYNAILDVLGKNRRFDEASKVLDKMSQRNGLFDEITYGVLLNRYAAAHMVDEAISVFNMRRDYGLETDLLSFRTLLMWLCRYKHVDEAETLFYSEKNKYSRTDIKTLNIILNGWCVLGDVREAKRFWKDIVGSKSVPDKFTYGTLINALTKKGKLGSAMKLFKEMWRKGIVDVVICNCMLDALCFKKRIPEALELFNEMNNTMCFPNVATYNSLIKHLCRIRRMEVVNDLVKEMEARGGTCSPNEFTYCYLLKSAKNANEVSDLLEKMKSSGCGMSGDLYNLVLKLYMGFDHEDGAKETWLAMERNGFGPNQTSYTIVIHKLHDRGRVEDALYYYNEMIGRGMLPEPRTEILVNAMNTKISGRGSKNNEDQKPLICRQRRKKIDIY